ncbi:9072_t:CDS:1, partial [Cetraspora pellucida]
STTYRNNIHQDMCFSENYKDPKLRDKLKGLKEVLCKRGLWHNGMKLVCKRGCKQERTNCCARTTMANQLDFIAQHRKLEEAIIAAGHKVIFYPKFHCELNYLENF